jgi:hypothetical protein
MWPLTFRIWLKNIILSNCYYDQFVLVPYLTTLQLSIESFVATHQSQSQSYIATDGQSVSMSWCRAQIWDFWPDIFFFFLKVTVLSWQWLTRIGKSGRGHRNTGITATAVPFCPPRIPHDVTPNRTRDTALGNWRLNCSSYDFVSSGQVVLSSEYRIPFLGK